MVSHAHMKIDSSQDKLDGIVRDMKSYIYFKNVAKCNTSPSTRE